jgi:short subunit dehydrogenase
MRPSKTSEEAAVPPTELPQMSATKRASILIVGRTCGADLRGGLAGQAAALAGSVDILINNTSTLGPVSLRLIPYTDCEDVERALQVNTIGPFRLTKAVVSSVILRQTGIIVNISSDDARYLVIYWYRNRPLTADRHRCNGSKRIKSVQIRRIHVYPCLFMVDQRHQLSHLRLTF